MSEYTRPDGIMGGPCLRCGASQPEHVGKTCAQVKAARCERIHALISGASEGEATHNKREAVRNKPMTLTQRVERLERRYFTEESAAVAAADGRFTRLDAHGRPTNGDHVAVYDAKTNLMWMADAVPGGTRSWSEAMEAAIAVRLFGRSDWCAPMIDELLSIIDYGWYNPAVNTEHFRGPFGYTWSSTIAENPHGSAWLVNLIHGDSYRNNQTYPSYVRAVRTGHFWELGR
jgi:hypothetical protein